nr:MAG TPA_asm: hypothetical protein [Bacteriophage sp.]
MKFSLLHNNTNCEINQEKLFTKCVDKHKFL